MMIGRITPENEAVFSLLVKGSTGQEALIDVAIDTGFNDFLTLQSSQITALALTRRAYIRATLADGNTVSLPVYTATVVWHGQPRQVDVLETGSGPLAGMALLHGSRVTLDVVDGGDVTIEPLP